MDVTPTVAHSWLSNYWTPTKEPWPYIAGKGLQKVRFYASEMQSKRWQITPHDPIKLTNLNELLDGRARLLAILKCGMTVPMTVAGNYYYDDWFSMHGRSSS